MNSENQQTMTAPRKPVASTHRKAVLLCKKILYNRAGALGVRSPLISIVKITCDCRKSKEGISVAFRNTDGKVWKAVVCVCKSCGKNKVRG